MRKEIYIYFFAVALLLCSFNGNAQTNNVKVQPKVPRLDSSEVKIPSFNKTKIDDYRQQREFKYESISKELTLWDRFWLWFWQKISGLIESAAKNPLSKYFFIGLGVAIIVFILYKVIGAEALFSKKSKETSLQYDVVSEDIHRIDYKAELTRLIADGKYRLAVRLLYLQSLKKLSDKELIDWRPEKTNYNYLREISEPNLKAEFARLTHQFDYIWYGDFPIDEERFDPINKTFSHFNAQIK